MQEEAVGRGTVGRCGSRDEDSKPIVAQIEILGHSDDSGELEYGKWYV